MINFNCLLTKYIARFNMETNYSVELEVDPQNLAQRCLIIHLLKSQTSIWDGLRKIERAGQMPIKGFKPLLMWYQVMIK